MNERAGAAAVRRVAWLAVTAALALVLAGCDAAPAGSQRAAGRATGAPVPTGDDAQLGSCVPKSGSGAPPGAGRPAGQLADLRLPCLAGHGTAAVARLGVPAVINLWASWCAPCRKELPHFQRFAERAGDRLLVIGVDSDDTRSAGQSLVTDLGLGFPMLFDDQATLRKAVGRGTLPVTLFVDAAGAVTFVHHTQALDEAAIRFLTQSHLGITVPP